MAAHYANWISDEMHKQCNEITQRKFAAAILKKQECRKIVKELRKQIKEQQNER